MRRPALVLALLAAAASCTSSNPAPVDSSTPTDVVVDMAPVDVFTGCTSNAGCAGSPGRPICNTSNGQCVSCTTMATACSAAQYCNSATGACEAGCSSDMGCATGGGDGGVDGGGAGGHCDTITHTCVQCVTNDHCPAGTVCRGSTCAAGCSAARACPTGQSCCDGACIDTQSNVSACGMCGNTCRTPNGRPACSMGTCGVGMCTAPYENCDMNAANGCEVDLQNDPTNCGACGNRCPSGTSSTGVCVMGRCSLGCAEGFADCDGMASNGCETNTRTDTSNCGMCARACSLSNATTACTDGACTVMACNTGFGDCDGNASSGCETNTTNTVAHCGRCGNACNLTNVASHGCAAGACTILTCDPGFADCDGMASNGCEVNTDTSGSNCGVCGRSCGMGMCTRGVCTSTCSGGRGDCDGNATNGCEADLNTETLNCGVCRNSCVAGPQSTARCTSGACSIVCNTGFSDCNANPADGCEIDTRVSPTNCGRCGNACASGQVCNDGLCVAPCPGIQTRCSGACVSLQTDNTNCGACGTRCATGNTCTDGVCRCAIGTEALAGVQCGTTCVDVLSSNTNCGTCGTACATGSTCTRGVCRCNISGLPVGILCGAACADPFSDRNNCGRCGNACATGQSCVSGACQCATGTTCGGACTDTTSDPANCGACGTRCATGQACLGGVCVTPGAGSFQITALNATGCATYDHVSLTGDDRGGIAVGTSNFFYNADGNIGRWNATDLSSPTALTLQHDGIVNDIATGTVYVLLNAAGTEPVGTGLSAPFTITQLGVLDATTGALTATRVTLSTPVIVGQNAGIFAGYGFILLHAGDAAGVTQRWYVIQVPSGTVSPLAMSAPPSHSYCENWAYWGIGERIGTEYYAVFVTNSTTISRYQVSNAATTTLATFTNLSDMCSITFSPSRNRWYWHHEGGSQFLTTGGEVAGYCAATWRAP